MKPNMFNILRDRILYMEYQPGQILNENVLAQEFEVSRSPVRNVLNRLEWEQLVRIIPRTGSMVTEIEFNKIMHVFQVRFECEVLEIQLAANQLNDSHRIVLKTIKERCAALFDNKDRKALVAVDTDLRNMIHEAAGNPVLKEISDRLYAQTFRLWYGAMDKGDWNEEVSSMVEEIRKLSDLIPGRDTKAMGAFRRKVLTDHFDRMRRKFFTH
ncbi:MULTISPECIES: GntR family transcriptional regulator [Desulfotignum]|jgi:DNA-binding GntR family transcriptional regulator|uniref:HTH-type transcriptional regulator, GntR family n=1 Tax=Desulfotignum phosphitoxidans DSM 13687 TaxID=1286635 RepID=S0G631_9BACT|nr:MULTISPECIES: GntR family transcriptional regulator [Desulfotignum]EMS80102.1 HTH-type transcriptional regulator, GntR family [Desulfotignum phosphitoxidans DSM 13687]